MNGSRGVMLVLPARFRNSNYARAAVPLAIVAVLFLFPLVSVPPAYKWFFAILFLGAAGLCVYNVLAARRVDLVVTEDGVVLGGVMRSRSLGWPEIARFEIRPPRQRTPFALAFAPGADRAKAVLTDGSSIRIRAVEPRHGYTALTYFTVARYNTADRTVDALNAVLARKRGAT